MRQVGACWSGRSPKSCRRDAVVKTPPPSTARHTGDADTKRKGPRGFPASPSELRLAQFSEFIRFPYSAAHLMSTYNRYRMEIKSATKQTTVRAASMLDRLLFARVDPATPAGSPSLHTDSYIAQYCAGMPALISAI